MAGLQYTIRNIPPSVDMVIRKRAKQSGKSFNQTIVDLLTMQTFGTVAPPGDVGFDWLFGQNLLDESFDDAIHELSGTDENLWK